MTDRDQHPSPKDGAAPFDRDALIALIMEETTDDIVADGWDRLGKPNVLVQGCRYIRRNTPPSPEGYENPEASAKQFAGFIADRVLKALATREEAPAPCKSCNGSGMDAGSRFNRCPDCREEAPAEARTGAQIKDYVHCPSGLVSGSIRAQPDARPGKVTWHSSGEDEGPDVGLQLDLGHGRSLWLGEGQKPIGWQFSLVHGDDIIPVADVIDHEQARDLFDLIASAVHPPARENARPIALPTDEGGSVTKRFVIFTKPGWAPEKKGGWLKEEHLIDFLRSVMLHDDWKPGFRATVLELTWDNDLWASSATEYLSIHDEAIGPRRARKAWQEARASHERIYKAAPKMKLGAEIDSYIKATTITYPAPDALRDAMAAIRAEINAPLTGPTHGAWDRGRIAGLKEALAALQAEQKGGA